MSTLLLNLGYEEDLDFCLAENTVPIVLCFEGGAFVGGESPEDWPGGQTGSRGGAKMFAKNILDKGVARLYSEVGHGGRTLQASPNRRGEEVQKMTITITHERVKEVTREDVDRAIDVIERHLEKEARTRNLLDEQAIMRPKDLCKQQGLDMVAELRGMV